MTPERWKQVEDIFQQAADRPPSERAQFLETACGVDSELRKEVESLLNSEGPFVNLLFDAVSDMADLVDRNAQTKMVGKKVGIYRLTDVIGHGGMGTVYRASRDDAQYKKEVALKIIKREMSSEYMVSRFLQERQILAHLEHPNIARLLDGGTTEDGLPFFVMEYIDGEPITEFCQSRELTVAERLQLILNVCSAIQYAHQKLVIHRDIKPSNILVDREGNPKLVDFGIAKLLNPDLSGPNLTETMTVLRLMTPEYASPEQVKGLPMSTATDIYSLGAVMYEVLTGQRAHQIKQYTPTEIERVICLIEVERPSAAVKRSTTNLAKASKILSGDLDNIVLMSMRKEPERRYQSAGQLSEDILRYLNGHPVIARPDTVAYRTRKFMGRHKLAVLAVLLIMTSLVVGIAAATYQAQRAERRFQQVRKLANTFLFDFHDEIAALPGSTKAREMLVQTALEYLDSLAKESQNDQDLLLELAAAYQKVGDVQGDPRGPNLGHMPEAVQSYEKALNITRNLLQQKPENLQVLRLQGVGLYKIGDSKVELGNITEGIKTLQEAVSTIEKVHAKKPGEQEDLLALMRALRVTVDAQLKQRTPAEALKTSFRAIELSRKMVAQFPSDVSEFHLTLSLHRMADAQTESGDLIAALKTFRSILHIRDSLTKKFPNNQVYKREWRLAHTYVGNTYGGLETFNLGDRKMGLEYYQKALAISEDLAKTDPKSGTFQHDLAICYARVADVILNTEPERAAHLYKKAQEINRILLENSNNEYRFLSRKALFARNLAAPLLLLGDRPGALKQLVIAQETHQSMVTTNPKNYEGEAGLQLTLNALGDVFFDARDFKQAKQYYTQAIQSGEKFAAVYPEDLYAKWRLANSYFDLGNVHVSQKNWREAREWFQKSYSIWHDWPKHAVSTTFDRTRKNESAKALSLTEAQLK